MKSGVPDSLDGARYVVLPDGITSSGFPAVKATCASIGLGFDPWQAGAAKCILAKDASGDYAADTVVLSIPRQVGKTFLVAALVFADCIVNPGTTVAWTAHRFSVARETFEALRLIAQSPALSGHIDPDRITTGTGNEVIPFLNGSRILFKAREKGTLRGFSKVRRLIIDEAQSCSQGAMADMVSTLRHAQNPQIILMGTPPKPNDPGEVFARFRQDALEGESEGTVYIEYGADPGCDLDDLDAWHQANPSLGGRTPLKAMKRDRKNLSDEDFARETLGIWDSAATGSVIDPDMWASLSDPDGQITGQVHFGVDVRPDYKSAAIALAGFRADGLRQVELIDIRSGTSWTVDRLVELLATHGGSVALDPSSPAGSLLSSLKDAGIEPVLVTGREMAQACGEFYTAVVDDDLRYPPSVDLTTAVDAARKRSLGDAWAWHRRDASADISPLVAATLALHTLGKPAPAPKQRLKRDGTPFTGGFMAV